MNKNLYDKKRNETKKDKGEKPFYKNWGLLALMTTLAVALFSGGSNENIEEAMAADHSVPTAQVETPVNHEKTLEKAEKYLSWAGSCPTELRKQLAAEGISNDAIDYAIAHATASYKVEANSTEDSQKETASEKYTDAIEKAENYLSWAGMSPTALRDQLYADGLSQTAIDHAIAYIDADYNEQALKKAKSYEGWASLSDEQLGQQLISHGFTKVQAQYAIDYL